MTFRKPCLPGSEPVRVIPNPERKQTQFQFVNRGFSEAILLIPGWAADYRIFNSLDLDFNYLLPIEFSLSGFEKALLESLKKESLDKISILGSSMGGFLGADFAYSHPERVKEITLMGMRQRYDKEGIEKVKEYIRTNRRAYLYKFYHESFSSEEKGELSLFKRNLMKDYLRELRTEELLDGLDYLAQAGLKADGLKNVTVRFIHGERDKIAPVENICALRDEIPDADMVILKGAGHMPFLRDDFRKVFHGK